MEWITTDNITVECWRRVLEYANTDFAFEAISKRHDRPTDNGLRANYKKQAEQIRVSIMQAHEYFDAAQASSLVTSPNHLYYGFVSLASAIMLLLGTGEKALDRLRRQPENRHHGLDFSTGVNHGNHREGLTMLRESYITVMKHGHFINWYQTLPLTYNITAIFSDRYNSYTATSPKIMGKEHILTWAGIVDKKFSLISALSRIPDIWDDLSRYGYSVPASRISIEVLDDHGSNMTTITFRIHGAPNTPDLISILERFKSHAQLYDNWRCTDYENQTGCIASFHFTAASENINIQYPSIRETINWDRYAYASALNTHEMVDFYVASYALSMLSRYYPDYWIGCLESHCIAAKAIEQFVYTAIRKGPMMALKFLTGEDIVVSTHRAPWL